MRSLRTWPRGANRAMGARSPRRQELSPEICEGSEQVGDCPWPVDSSHVASCGFSTRCSHRIRGGGRCGAARLPRPSASRRAAWFGRSDGVERRATGCRCDDEFSTPRLTGLRKPASLPLCPASRRDQGSLHQVGRAELRARQTGHGNARRIDPGESAARASVVLPVSTLPRSPVSQGSTLDADDSALWAVG